MQSHLQAMLVQMEEPAEQIMLSNAMVSSSVIWDPGGYQCL